MALIGADDAEVAIEEAESDRSMIVEGLEFGETPVRRSTWGWKTGNKAREWRALTKSCSVACMVCTLAEDVEFPRERRGPIELGCCFVHTEPSPIRLPPRMLRTCHSVFNYCRGAGVIERGLFSKIHSNSGRDVAPSRGVVVECGSRVKRQQDGLLLKF